MNYGTEEHGDVGRTRHGSQTFYALLQEAAETHDKKSHDYASDSKPSGNYHFAGEMAIMFSHSPQDAGFVGRLAEKIYRIKNLESSGRLGITESIEDTERDIFTITALWIADRRDRRRKKLEAIQKVQDQMKAGEWTGSLAERPVGFAPINEIELQKRRLAEQVSEEMIAVINSLSNLAIQQLIDYSGRLLSDRRVEGGKNPTETHRTESPSRRTRV